jgi:very-short-patch-repair endonuclease
MIQPKKINKKQMKREKEKIPRKKRGKNIAPIRKEVEFWVYKKYKISKEDDINRQNLTVQSSKLEYLFMRNFLDKLGVKYIHQWYSPIGFVYDFAILSEDGAQIQLLIEIDGNYFHTNPKMYPNGPIYENQKRQVKRDEEKNKWAAYSNFVLLRFWEDDIHNNPKQVMEILKKRIG